MARFGDPDIARLAQADSGLAHLPAWLIVKEFKPSAIASLDADRWKEPKVPRPLRQLPGNPLLHPAQLRARLRPGSDALFAVVATTYSAPCIPPLGAVEWPRAARRGGCDACDRPGRLWLRRRSASGRNRQARHRGERGPRRGACRWGGSGHRASLRGPALPDEDHRL